MFAKKDVSPFLFYNLYMITNVFQFDWEVNLMVWIQTNIVNTPFMIKLCTVFTYLGEPVVGVFIIGIIYFGFDKKYGKQLGINMLASSVINPLIKNIFFRIRPYFANDNIKCLKKVDESADIYDVFAQGYSFPSGHTMASTSLFSTLALFIKKNIAYIIATILISLVGFSRFALGVHYPTDVLVGALTSLLIVTIYTQLRKRFSEDRIIIVSALLFSVGLFYCKTNDYYQTYGLFLGLVLGILFEKRFVNFEGTKNILRIISRIVFGTAVFFIFNKGLKLPFSKEFFDSGSAFSKLITMLRYGLGIFMTMGVYPILFKYNLFKFDEKNKDGN